MMRRIGYALGVGILLSSVAASGYAQDPAAADIFRSGFYGGLAGALVGAAALAFTDDPEDHLDYIGIGAGIGVFSGTAYGIYTATRAVAMLEGSATTWSVPIPEVVRIPTGVVQGKWETQYRIHLFGFRF